MPSANEFRAVSTYVSYYVEMPAGTLEAVVEDAAAQVRLKADLKRVPGLENLELDTSNDYGCVHFTLTAEEACEENLDRVEGLLRDATRKLESGANAAR